MRIRRKRQAGEVRVAEEEIQGLPRLGVRLLHKRALRLSKPRLADDRPLVRPGEGDGLFERPIREIPALGAQEGLAGVPELTGRVFAVRAHHLRVDLGALTLHPHLNQALGQTRLCILRLIRIGELLRQSVERILRFLQVVQGRVERPETHVGIRAERAVWIGLPLSSVLAENESPDFEEILKVDEWQATPVAVRAQRPQIFPVDLDVALETRSRGAPEPHCRHAFRQIARPNPTLPDIPHDQFEVRADPIVKRVAAELRKQLPSAVKTRMRNEYRKAEHPRTKPPRRTVPHRPSAQFPHETDVGVSRVNILRKDGGNLGERHLAFQHIIRIQDANDVARGEGDAPVDGIVHSSVAFAPTDDG